MQEENSALLQKQKLHLPEAFLALLRCSEGQLLGHLCSGSGKAEGTATLQKGNNSQLTVFSRDPISKGAR